MKKIFIGLISLGFTFLLGIMVLQNVTSVSATSQENVIPNTVCPENHENCNGIHLKQESTSESVENKATVNEVSNTVCSYNHPNCSNTHLGQSNLKNQQTTNQNTVKEVVNTVCPYGHQDCDGIHQNGTCLNDHTNCKHSLRQQGSKTNSAKRHSGNHNGLKHH